MYWAVTSPLVF